MGKIEIDSAILNKPAKLTPEERKIMERHTVIGEKILPNGAGSSIKNEPMLETAAQICRRHHERYDGCCPDGLKGDEIPIAAQVVSLADVYDALVSRCVYKEPYSGGKGAFNDTCGCECGSFNPLLLECLCNISDKFINDVYNADAE